jgi:hypothetical protein
MATYQVIVGNIGTVYTGECASDAWADYHEYVGQSLAEHGRASGESVTIMEDDALLCEFIGAVADRVWHGNEILGSCE